MRIHHHWHRNYDYFDRYYDGYDDYFDAGYYTPWNDWQSRMWAMQGAMD